MKPTGIEHGEKKYLMSQQTKKSEAEPKSSLSTSRSLQKIGHKVSSFSSTNATSADTHKNITSYRTYDQSQNTSTKMPGTDSELSKNSSVRVNEFDARHKNQSTSKVSSESNKKENNDPNLVRAYHRSSTEAQTLHNLQTYK